LVLAFLPAFLREIPQSLHRLGAFYMRDLDNNTTTHTSTHLHIRTSAYLHICILLGPPTYHCPLSFPPSPISRSFLRQPPLPDNMLLSHITLTPAWAWAWALLPVLVTYAVLSRVRTWLRLRHIPGPPLVGWSKAWLLRKALGGCFHLDTAEVCEKYG
jgi:hypothetical protein